MHEDKIINISISSLTPSTNQPRKIFDEKAIDDLANSIKQYGILNPIIVRPNNGSYEIVAGERRYRAAKKIGLEVVPVIIKNIDDTELSELALIENIMRENLTPIEEAAAYKEILQKSKINESDLAKKIGKSQSFISNKIRLLTLPKEVQTALNDKKISERHARSLLQIKNPSEQIKFLNRIITDRLTVKELDEIIKNLINEEEDISTAIKSIMSSLKKDPEDQEIIQKEEKESDNMNQGNFFPNFNQPMPTQPSVEPQISGGQTLNTMNMQTMVNPIVNNQPSTNATPTTPLTMPQINNTESIPNPAPVESLANNITNQANINQPFVEPLFTPTIEPPMAPTAPAVPNLTPDQLPNPEPAVSTPTEPIAPIIEDIPLFNNMTSTPNPAPVTGSVEIPVVTSPVVESTPVNPEPVVPPVIQEQPAPINPSTAPVETPQAETPDKLTQTKEFLNQNNIPYKLYNNETGHCIIIEI